MSTEDGWRSFSRREWLKQVGAGAAAMPAAVFLPMAPADAGMLGAQSGTSAPREALETLTTAEADTLEAITARLIPTDASGPGAVEARAARYIDRALGGTLAPFRDAYRTGLSAIEAHAQKTKGAAFTRLSPPDQDAVLRDVERNVAAGFSQPPAAFFGLVLAHTIQGTFGDPYYGGNANFAGWDLIGYPGVRLAVSASEQALNAQPKPTHMSAYDYTMFSGRTPARASSDQGGGGHHGD